MIKAGALWVVWCVLHSLLITLRAQRWIASRGRAWQGMYRLGYVCFATGSVAGLLLYTASLPQRPLALPAWLLAVQVPLLGYALAMFIGGAKVYDLRTFLGIRQWQDFRAGRENAVPRLSATGILRYVRHPWYSGGIALLWALPGLTDLTLLTRAVLSCYLIVGALLEEAKLKSIFGETYRSYCRQVPMLIPWRLNR